MKIGIIGHGIVGRALARVWLEHADVRIYDTNPVKSVHPLAEVAAADYIFVCVPTDRCRGSFDCNTTIVESVLTQLDALPSCGIVVISSTVPLGATKQWSGLYQLTLVHQPEFITERDGVVDAHTPARHIIGWTPNQRSIVAARHLAELMERRFPGVPALVMSSDEAELVKLASNSLFATKIALFTELRAIADAAELHWDQVLGGIMADGRIGQSHTTIPGPDGQRGFGGRSLPTDLANLMICARRLGVDTPVMHATWVRNLKDRTDQRL